MMNNPKSQENAQRRQEIADLAEVSTGQVRLFSYELSVLRNRGLLVALNIEGTGMFERKAEFNEYGMGDDDIRKGRLKPGRKLILPVDANTKAFNSIAATLRNLLKKYSNNIPGFYPYKFVPFEAFRAKFKPKFEECKVLWDCEIERVVENLDGYRDIIAAQAAQEAAKAWESLDGLTIGDAEIDYEEYIDYCVARDTADIPTEEDIREKLSLDYYVAMVYGAADVARDQLEAQDMETRARMAKENLTLENQMMAEAVRTKAARNQIEEDTLRAKREAIVAAEAEHIRKQLVEKGSPFDQIVRDARERAANSAAEILKSIKSNSFLHGKVAEKGKGLKEYFELMATHEDAYLMDMLKRLDTQIGKISTDKKNQEPRDTAAITETLEEIMKLAKAEFQTLMTDEGYFAAIEVD